MEEPVQRHSSQGKLLKLPRKKRNNNFDRLFNLATTPPRKTVNTKKIKEVLKNKVCRLCHRSEPDVEFHLLGRGYDKRCKDCKSVARKKRWQRDKHKEYLQRKEREKKPEYRYMIRMRSKIRMRDDADYAFRVSMHHHVKRLYQDVGGRRLEDYDDILGCTIKEAREHFERKFQPGMSWCNHGEWHIDHIRPLASFDLTQAEERRKAGHYTNLQPLWAHDNLSKGAKYDEEI